MIFDLIGVIGVVMIVAMYALAQLQRIDVNNLSYSIINALGAGLIIVSLLVDFNLSAFIMEAFWLVFSLAGIYRSLRASKSTESPLDSQ